LTLSEFHHSQAKAFIDIGGYAIPAYYQDAVAEFHAAQKAAMMDRSFAGKLRVLGKDRESLLHRLTANEMRNLKNGEGVVNIFTNAKGRVVDVVEMFMMANSIFLLTSPDRAKLVKEWIEKYTFIEEVKSEEVTSQYSMISLCGAESAACLLALFDCQVNDLPAQHAHVFVEGDKSIIVQRSGMISPMQFNVIIPASEMEKFWQRLLTKATPIGHTAYEMLRIHRGLPAVDKEITEEYNPHEVGLHPFINFEKGCYIGQEVIARLDSYQKVQRQLTGVNLEIKESDANLFSSTAAPIYAGDQLIGQLTSVCFSSERGHAIGLAVVRKQFVTQTDPVQVRWPKRTVPGRLQDLPFQS
jgi:hypothetical protein